MAHSEIDSLISLFSKLPSLGPRSARRIVLQLIRKRESLMEPLTQQLATVMETITTCTTCGNLDNTDPCSICSDNARDPAVICVVEDLADLWAIERSHMFKGRYHILGGVLSAMDGVGPDQLNMASLFTRAADDSVTEIIIATNATIDGQTTAHYLTERLQDAGVSITRLAQGVPIGGELDYLDDGTLGAALASRRPF